ncbi:MAG: hypothetical protein NC230_06355 [Bacteroides sp.]|nr:hypothetical protein [Bacteroides sp.]MCM1414281.1 hypothetical protein [Bacteroides sp.]
MSFTPKLDNIKKFFRINPDYEGCFGHFSVDNCSYGCDDDTLELEGYEATPFVVPGIEKWCYQWDEMAHSAKDGTQCNVDGFEWVARGRHLAQQLRQILPDEITLLYKPGDKDELIEKIEYFILSPDTCQAIGNTNVLTETYDGDTVEVADFPPITLPGLDKWWNEFDDHIDYADFTADPDFDWTTWNLQGIHFASIIRKHLPDTVEVWYSTPFEIRNITDFELRFNPDGTIDMADFMKEHT